MQNDPTDTPQVIRLAEGLYVRQAVDNIGWIDLGDAALVVDALEQPELRDEIFAAIAETLPGKAVRYVLNTHTHYDHVALNDAFVRKWGSEIVSLPASRIDPAGRWFQGPLRKVLMLPLGDCHTHEDCVVWCPDARVLFTGDIFGWGLIPLTTPLRDDSADLLIATYARMIELDAAAVVPGHGPVCTNNELCRWVEYFRWLMQEARDRLAAGKPEAQVTRELAPPADMAGWWRFHDWKHADSVGKVVSAVRRGRLNP